MYAILDVFTKLDDRCEILPQVHCDLYTHHASRQQPSLLYRHLRLARAQRDRRTRESPRRSKYCRERILDVEYQPNYDTLLLMGLGSAIKTPDGRSIQSSDKAFGVRSSLNWLYLV